MRIDEIGLSVRTYNVLSRTGIRTVEELKSMSDEELCKVRNLGRKSLLEILEKLKSLGIERCETND